MIGEPLPPHCSDPMFLQDLAMSGQPLPPECQSAPSMWDMLGNLFSPGKQQVGQGSVSFTDVGPIDCEWEWDEWTDWTEWGLNALEDGEFRERTRTRIQTVSAQYGGSDCQGQSSELAIETRPLEDESQEEEDTTNEVIGEETGESDEENRWSKAVMKGQKALTIVGGITVVGIGTYIYIKRKG